MVKRIKEVSPDLVEEIRKARKYVGGLSIYGTFVSVKPGKRAWQTKELLRKEQYS